MTTLWMLPFSGTGANTDRLLSRVAPEKRARLASIGAEVARLQSLYADLLVRILICKLFGAHNKALTFDAGEHGKPYMPEHSGICFNVSHTEGAVVAAVADHPVGVDIESRTRKWYMQVAGRFFSEDEIAYITQNAAEQTHRFFEVWTKKEAWIKYTGEGLSQPLSSFSVRSGQTAAMLRTIDEDGYLISICCEDPPDSVKKISEQDFLELAMELEEVR